MGFYGHGSLALGSGILHVHTFSAALVPMFCQVGLASPSGAVGSLAFLSNSGTEGLTPPPRIGLATPQGASLLRSDANTTQTSQMKIH